MLILLKKDLVFRLCDIFTKYLYRKQKNQNS